MPNNANEIFVTLIAAWTIGGHVVAPFWVGRDAERRDPDAAGRWVFVTILFGFWAVLFWRARRPPRIVRERPYPTWYAREV